MITGLQPLFIASRAERKGAEGGGRGGGGREREREEERERIESMAQTQLGILPTFALILLMILFQQGGIKHISTVYIIIMDISCQAAAVGWRGGGHLSIGWVTQVTCSPK